MEAKVTFIVLCAIGMSFGASILPGESETIPFCHDLDCPKYTVSQRFADFELRHYEPTMWVATNETTTNSDASTYQLFMRLFGYISGKNAKGIKIQMTAPVVKKFTPLKDGSMSIVMHFMIPHDMQDSAPEPTDPSVYLTSMPAMSVYVKTFGGYTNTRHDQEAIQTLEDELHDSSMYDTSVFFTAGYDSPYTFINRHNEVWLLSPSV